MANRFLRVLGVDPSLRNTGLAVVTYDTELLPSDPNAYKITGCQVLKNPIKFKGKDAILNMLDMMYETSFEPIYTDVDHVLVESPPIMFNKAFSSSIISSIAHVAGGAVAIYGIQKAHIFQPNEWNKNRKKEVSQKKIIEFLGEARTWDFKEKIKTDSLLEHIVDAAGLATWWIKSNYLEE